MELSALTLLLTAIGLFYNAWEKNIQHCLQVDVPQNEGDFKDNKGEYRGLKRVYRYKILPLFIFSFIIGTIFFPHTKGILFRAVNLFIDEPFKAFQEYQVVEAAYVAANFAIWGLVIHFFNLFAKLRKKMDSFEKYKN